MIRTLMICALGFAYLGALCVWAAYKFAARRRALFFADQLPDNLGPPGSRLPTLTGVYDELELREFIPPRP
jgi:hypothetical protein